MYASVEAICVTLYLGLFCFEIPC